MATVERIDPSPTRSKPNSEILDRQPPRNLDAEKAVLGSILLVPECCDDVVMHVRADEFYDDAHRTLYAHMLALHENGGRIDAMLLAERLRQTGDFELIGGAAYLAELAQFVPTAAHAVYYSKIIRDKASLRSLIHAGTEILRDAYDESVEPRQMLSRAEEKIFSILEQQGTGQLASLGDVLHEAMLRIDARLKNEHAVGGVDTGFTQLDSLLGGLRNSELVILAARPSMGKTAFALNIAEYASLKCEVTTLFISLEMSALELADRVLCSYARVNGHQLRTGMITKEDRRRVVEKAADLSQAPLMIDDSPSRTMTEIAATARRLKRKNKLGLIVIDYLQLIEPDNAKDPRQEQVARIARRLKGMARELNVPVVCLAQLNRQAETGGTPRPRLSHLRESGAIEQDADVVMFIHREEAYLTPEERRQARNDGSDILGVAEIQIAKQRNGPTGDVKLTWLEQFTRFENYAQKPYEELAEFNDGF